VDETLALPKPEQRQEFDRLRKQGMLTHNKGQMKLDEPAYQREQKGAADENLILCGSCSGFFAKSYFWRHRKRCHASASRNLAVPLALLKSTADVNLSDEFKQEILSKFAQDECGKLCTNDETLMLVGQRMFSKINKKKDKKTEVRKSVMTDMRRLASLFLAFKNATRESLHVEAADIRDMFVRRNFNALKEAVETYTSTADGVKHGLKYGLYYLIKNAAKIIKSSMLIADEDDKAAEIDKFVLVLEISHSEMFGDAVYAINNSRQIKLRRPDQLPTEEDVSKVRAHSISRMSSFYNAESGSVFYSGQEFVELRDLTVSRLTMFNARRGGEPARLLMSEWTDAMNNVWIDPTNVVKMNAVDQQLFHEMKVAYQTGKGNNHLVPVLVPSDTLQAMTILSDAAVRVAAGIKVSNQYMFPCAQASDGHVSGWHAVSRVCRDARVVQPERLTATKMRHRASTLYAAMDVPASDRQYFYKHMGHSAAINADVYQTPPAEAEVLKVGRRLQIMDGDALGKYIVLDLLHCSIIPKATQFIIY
jgi:hypothetical protein